jgi:hypothetical protein
MGDDFSAAAFTSLCNQISKFPQGATEILGWIFQSAGSGFLKASGDDLVKHSSHCWQFY